MDKNEEVKQTSSSKQDESKKRVMQDSRNYRMPVMQTLHTRCACKVVGTNNITTCSEEISGRCHLPVRGPLAQLVRASGS